MIVDDGDTLINCLAYIDLNPVRAEMVEKPEEYRWSSIGYHIQRNNEDAILSLDFGLLEFGVMHASERARCYRKFLYEKGGIDDGGQMAEDGAHGRAINRRIVEAERKRDFALSEFDRFRYRTRYFIDSGIIGSKEFVDKIYQRYKHYFLTNKEKHPKPIRGLEGVYSLKRLSETI